MRRLDALAGAVRMSFAHYLKHIGRGGVGPADPSEYDAFQLFSAVLDGGVPELELGALLLAMRVKSESLPELLGFYSARRAAVAPARACRQSAAGGSAELQRRARATEPAAAAGTAVAALRRAGTVHGVLNGSGRIAARTYFASWE